MSEFTKFVTKKPVRISFPSLFQPYQGDGMSTPKYTCTMLIPKTDTEMIQEITAAFGAAQQEAMSPTGIWKGIAPPQPAMTFYDGDAPKASGEAWGEECKGHYVLRSGSGTQPGVVDQFGNKLLDATKIYSGCWCYVSVNMFPYLNSGNRGLSCGLNNVMFAKDDESFGGGHVAPEQDFAALIAQNKATAPAMQMPAPTGFAPQPAMQQPIAYAPGMPVQQQMPVQQPIAPPVQAESLYGAPQDYTPAMQMPAPQGQGFMNLPQGLPQ